MITVQIVNYGIGNIGNLVRAVSSLSPGNGKEFKIQVAKTPGEFSSSADKTIIPGVGAFAVCVREFRALGFEEALGELISKQQHVLGVCVAMQMMFERGFEHISEVEVPDQPAAHKGLGHLSGEVASITGLMKEAIQVPRIGWYPLQVNRQDGLLRNIENEYFYFVHSFSAQNVEPSVVTSTSPMDTVQVVATVQKNCLWGVQFHPERSGSAGLSLLKNFLLL